MLLSSGRRSLVQNLAYTEQEAGDVAHDLVTDPHDLRFDLGLESSVGAFFKHGVESVQRMHQLLRVLEDLGDRGGRCLGPSEVNETDETRRRTMTRA